MKKAILSPLPYSYNALEPVISEEIMYLHHDKHHRGYVNQWNLLLDQYERAVEEQDFQKATHCATNLRFHGGGIFNHNFFWETLWPVSELGAVLPQGEFLSAIQRQFGSLDGLIGEICRVTVLIQGSGWGWLLFDPNSRQLVVTTSKNQNLFAPSQAIALLNIDVWEHAYYLQYKNNRAKYLEEIFKVICWEKVEKRYLNAL